MIVARTRVPKKYRGVVFTQPETGAQVVVHDFTEAHARNSYDGDDEYVGVPVRYIHIINSAGNYIRGWKVDRIPWSWQKPTELVKKQIKDATDWLNSYYWKAKYYHPDDPRRGDRFLECNNIDGRWHPCSQLHAGQDGRAKCRIRPVSCGYSGGQDTRDVPIDHQCDVFKIIGNSSGFDWDIPGSKLTMRDYWRIISGQAMRDLFPSKKEEEINHGS